MVSDYKRRIVLNLDFDHALVELLQAFEAEGVEPIARVDVRDHFRHTLGHDFHNLRRYLLFQVWSPYLALETHQRNADGEAILPATFAISELASGETAVTASEPLSWLLWDPVSRGRASGLAAFADEQDERVGRVLTRLQQHAAVKHAPVASAA